MRKFVVPLFSFLLGILVALIITVALVIYGSSLMEHSNSAGRARDLGTSGSVPAAGRPQSLSPQYTRGWELLNAGRPKEAQDVFLQILAADSEDRHAMQGLVAARRAVVGDDPKELRRQAAMYQDAMRQGMDLGDHYTRAAMGALALASEQAAEEVEARNGSAPIVLSEAPQTPVNRPQPPSPKDKIPSTRKLPPSTHMVKPQAPVHSATLSKNAVDTQPAAPAARTSGPPPAATAPQTPAPPPAATAPQTPAASPAATAPQTPALPPVVTSPQTPAPPPAVTAPQSPAPPPAATVPQTAAPAPGANARLYMVRVGPVSNRDQASALEKELLSKGFSLAKVTAQQGEFFQVVSEPLPRSVAENLAATLAGRGVRSRVEPSAGDTTHLVFGVFASQNDAEALVRRINAQGYDAWVTREGTAYALELGPYPESTVDTITGIIKSSAPEATVTADLTASPPHPAATPQTAAPSLSGTAHLYVVRVGPVSDKDQASALEKALLSKGFASAKVTTQTGVLFQVVSEPLPRSVAENLAATLAGRGVRSRVEPSAGDTTHLVFGVFTSQNDAEALVRRINAQGYDAWVTREGTAFMIELGPYPQSTVDTITGIIKSSAPEAAVVADPAP